MLAPLARRASLKVRRKGLESRLQRVVDAYLYEDKIDKATYEQQRARLDKEIAAVEEAIDSTQPEALDLARTLRFAERLLTDPAGCWQVLAPKLKPRFQRALYPNGMSYEDGTFGPGETSWAFNHLHGKSSSDHGMASHSTPT